MTILSAALQSCSEEAKLFTGRKERFLPTCSCLPGHREIHASPAMQKASATSLSSLTGSFQKMTRHVSDITQMAVSRCLNFCKSGYVIRINASASKYSATTLAVGGGGFASWHRNMIDLKRKPCSLVSPVQSWQALVWVSILMTSAL